MRMYQSVAGSFAHRSRRWYMFCFTNIQAVSQGGYRLLLYASIEMARKNVHVAGEEAASLAWRRWGYNPYMVSCLVSHRGRNRAANFVHCGLWS